MKGVRDMTLRFLLRLPTKAMMAATGLTLTAAVAASPTLATTQPTPNPTNPATAVTQAVQPVQAGQPAAPARQALLPDGVPAGQQAFTPSGEQMSNVRAIVDATKQTDLPDRAAVIAVATSLQESKLVNLGHLGARNDHDSLGLFQQRPSSGWGSPEQITDADYSTKAFLQGLKQVDGWDRMPLTEAAQTVQVSAYPQAYAKWEKMAADLVLATHHTGPYAEIK